MSRMLANGNKEWQTDWHWLEGVKRWQTEMFSLLSWGPCCHRLFFHRAQSRRSLALEPLCVLTTGEQTKKKKHWLEWNCCLLWRNHVICCANVGSEDHDVAKKKKTQQEGMNQTEGRSSSKVQQPRILKSHRNKFVENMLDWLSHPVSQSTVFIWFHWR